MGLTVREKDHWRERNAQRIDRKIETIRGRNPGVFEQVRIDSQHRALASLELDDLQRQLDETLAQEKRLAQARVRVERAMLARIRGVPEEELASANNTYGVRQEIETAVRKRREGLEDELLSESEIGRQVLNLRTEKDNLIDSIWLATSPSCVKELWSKVAALLDEPQTQLERDALAIEPPSEP
ncbi:MAG: hypothetical protein N2C14_02685 [Planctomycetales bacterium]